MTEENQKNTVATVGMRFSIIWLIALISLFFAWLSCPLLFIWFILWIIGLFYKPRWKARVAICIPLIIWIAIISLICFLWKSIKAPTMEFIDWAKPQIEQIENNEIFDWNRFGDLLQEEFNNLTNDKTEEDWNALFESSTGSNSIEKAAYMFSSIAKQWFENALEKYNNELPEPEDDININDENEALEDIENTEDNAEYEEIEISSQTEWNDIEEILDTIE